MGRLTLTRKHGERVLLRGPAGEETWVTVQKGRQSRVRLIFDAPDNVRILRAEFLEKGKRDGKRDENEELQGLRRWVILLWEAGLTAEEIMEKVGELVHTIAGDLTVMGRRTA